MKPWLYTNTEFTKLEDFPQDCFGFIYKITNTLTNQYYVGKKFLHLL